MQTETPTTPTIAELWREFEMKLKGDDYDKWMANLPEDHSARKEYQKRKDALDALRAQLAERCKRPPRVAMAGSVQFFIDSHKEHSAYHAFKALELEQRQKELQEAPI